MFCLSVLSCIHLLRAGRMREPYRSIIRFFIRFVSYLSPDSRVDFTSIFYITALEGCRCT